MQQAFATADAQTKVYWSALAAALLLGVFLRLNGYLRQQPSLWLDEALWAPRFVNWPLEKLGIRPIGFVWLTRWIVRHLSASEFWFRFLPNFGGLLSLLFMPYVASRLFERRVLRLALVVLFAIHPALVDLSKEFKPYSFEVFVHLLSVVLFLRYEQTRKAGYLYALLVYLPCSFLLAYNMAFALPSLLLLVFWSGIKRRSWVLVLASVLGAGACLVVVHQVNQRLLQKVVDEGRTENYWGRKYEVFYRPERDGNRAAWMLAKAADTIAISGIQRELWTDDARLPRSVAPKLEAADRALWMVLGLLGAAWLLRWQRERALLFLMPLVVLVAVNALGKWPLGQFRTNLFMCVYVLPLPLWGIELVSGFRVPRIDLLRVALLALMAFDALGGFLFMFDAQGHKRLWCKDGQSREVLQTLLDFRKQELRQNASARPARLVLDLFSYRPLDYYLEVHPDFSRYKGFFDHNFRTDRVASTRLLDVSKRRVKEPGLVYAVASKRRSALELLQFAQANPKQVIWQKQIDDEVVVLVFDR